ncbi:MAG TPA: malic enzyme-like NAD(P)-binding protein [Acidimicrobiia bacterium]|nr:malic enzyme-like NAD(P)-binding protein [Acidimicrobiia bacterium]
MTAVLPHQTRTMPAAARRALPDRTLSAHAGGKIGIAPRFAVADADDLARVYTPGVGHAATAIARDPERVWDLTIRRNAVAILTNGTAVLGLGDIGPRAALPVMEGKALLCKTLGGINAYPICVDAPTVDELVAVATAIAPTFGAINLEDVAAPMCFAVERRIRDTLDVPVFHDDQHGTATVVAAALRNAARVVGRSLADLQVAIVGAGAAGTATTELLLALGVGDVVVVDRHGILHPQRPGIDARKHDLARRTNRAGRRGDLECALRGADVLIGVSRPSIVRPEWLATMRHHAIVFALANPVPEVMPDAAPSNVAIFATGRSDHPNQINNVLAFPGMLRGLLDGGARRVDLATSAAAAIALADLVPPDDLGPHHIVPSPFDARVVPTVARAVQRATTHR